MEQKIIEQKKKINIRNVLPDDEVLELKNTMKNINLVEKHVDFLYWFWRNFCCFSCWLTWLYSWLILMGYLELLTVSTWACCMLIWFTYSRHLKYSNDIVIMEDFRSIITTYFSSEKDFVEEIDRAVKEIHAEKVNKGEKQ